MRYVLEDFLTIGISQFFTPIFFWQKVLKVSVVVLCSFCYPNVWCYDITWYVCFLDLAYDGCYISKLHSNFHLISLYFLTFISWFYGSDYSSWFYRYYRTVGAHLLIFYGLAKVDKRGLSIRPIFSMPGTSCDSLSKHLATTLSNLPDCNIATKPHQVATEISRIQLQPDGQLISMDLTSLFAMAPAVENLGLTKKLVWARSASWRCFRTFCDFVSR